MDGVIQRLENCRCSWLTGTLAVLFKAFIELTSGFPVAFNSYCCMELIEAGLPQPNLSYLFRPWPPCRSVWIQPFRIINHYFFPLSKGEASD